MPPKKKKTWTYTKRRRGKKKILKAVPEPVNAAVIPPSENLTLSKTSTDPAVQIKNEVPSIPPPKPDSFLYSTALIPAFGLLESQKILNTEPTRKVKQEPVEESTEVENSPPRVTLEIVEDDCEIVAAGKPVKKMKTETVVNWNEDVICLGESVFEIEAVEGLPATESPESTSESPYHKAIKMERAPKNEDSQLLNTTESLNLTPEKKDLSNLDKLLENMAKKSAIGISKSVAEPMTSIEVIDLEVEDVGPSQTNSIIHQEMPVKSEPSVKDEMNCDTAPSSPSNATSSSQDNLVIPEELQFSLLSLSEEISSHGLNSLNKPVSTATALKKDAIFSTDILPNLEPQDANENESSYDFASELQEFSDLNLSKGLFTLEELYLFVKTMDFVSFHLQKKFASKEELGESFKTSLHELASSCIRQNSEVDHNISYLVPNNNFIKQEIGNYQQPISHMQTDTHQQINSNQQIKSHLKNISETNNKSIPLEVNRIDISQLKNILATANVEKKSPSTVISRKRSYSELQQYSNSDASSCENLSDPRLTSKSNSVQQSESVLNKNLPDPRLSSKNNSAFLSESAPNSSCVDPRRLPNKNLESRPQPIETCIRRFSTSPSPKKPRSEINFRKNFTYDDAEDFINSALGFGGNYPNIRDNLEQANYSRNQNEYSKSQKTKKIDLKEYIQRRNSGSIEGSPRLGQLDSPKSVAFEKYQSNSPTQISVVRDPRLNKPTIHVSGVVRQPPSEASSNVEHIFNINAFQRNDGISHAQREPRLGLLTPGPPRFGLLPAASQPPSESLPKQNFLPKINCNKENSFPFVNLVPNALIQDIGVEYIQSSQLYLICIGWRVEWFSEYEYNCKMSSDLSLPPILHNNNPLSQVRNTYRDKRDHYNTYLKLLLVDCWYKLYASWKRQLNQEFYGKVRECETRNEFIKYSVDYFVPVTERDNMPDDGSILQVTFTKKNNVTFTALGYVPKVMNRRFEAFHDQNNEAFKILNTSGSNILKYRVFIYTVYKCEEIDITKMVTHKKLVNIRRFLQQNDALNNLCNSPLCPAVLSPITSPHKLSLTIDSNSGVHTAVSRLSERLLISGPLLALVNSQLSLQDKSCVISKIIHDIRRKKPESKVMICSKSERRLSDMMEALQDMRHRVVCLNKLNKDRTQILRKYSLKKLIEKRIGQNQSLDPEQTQTDVLKECEVISIFILGYFEDELFDELNIACCILDDAHECTEPESVIPLSCDKITKYVLFGNKDDLCDVSPITASYEYNRSLFNRASL